MANHILARAARKLKPVNVERERLTSLINSMSDGVLAVDHTMKVVTRNGAALNILDVNNSLEGKRLHTVFHPRNQAGHLIDIERLVANTKTSTENRDLIMQYADGSRINLYLSITPVHTGYRTRGRQGYVLLMRDITREKSLEEERNEFISVVSHELRTPIAIAEGDISNAQFIVEKGSNLPAVKAALEQAHQQTVFLAEMINDLSTLSRAERGKLVVEVAPINTTALLESLEKDYEKEAKNKGLELNVSVEKDLPTLQSSELYVREILQNFITNALKYTQKGSVSITAKEAENGITFEIKDSGIGISKTDQDRVFDKFFRSEDYRTRQTSGTGLGLYVTAKLARLIQADIELTSKLNHGSTFSVFIPNLPESTTTSASAAPRA